MPDWCIPRRTWSLMCFLSGTRSAASRCGHVPGCEHADDGPFGRVHSPFSMTSRPPYRGSFGKELLLDGRARSRRQRTVFADDYLPGIALSFFSSLGDIREGVMRSRACREPGGRTNMTVCRHPSSHARFGQIEHPRQLRARPTIAYR